MNDAAARGPLRIETACFLDCPKCRSEGLEPRIQAAISWRGLIIICRNHELEVVFDLSEIAKRMIEASQRDHASPRSSGGNA